MKAGGKKAGGKKTAPAPVPAVDGPGPPKPKEPEAKVSLPMFKQPSASNAEAFVMCGASHVLQQSDSHNDYMYRGSEGHEPLAAVINERTPRTTERGVAMVKDFPLGIVLKDVGLREAEVAYAVNVKTKTSRRIGKDLGREYGPLARYEVPCTLDAVGFKEGKRWLRDWKFGQSGSWWQILVQCMALAYKATPEDEPDAIDIDAGFVFIDGETGGRIYHEDARLVSLEEIDEACDKLFVAWGKVEQMASDRDATRAQGWAWAPSTIEGDWCTYCGGYDACPSKWAMSRALLGELLSNSENFVGMSLEKKGEVWARTREAKRLIATVEEALKGAAIREGCLPLPNGKFLTMVECSGRVSIDKDEALATIRRLGGGPTELEGVMKQGRGFVTAKELNKRSEL